MTRRRRRRTLIKPACPPSGPPPLLCCAIKQTHFLLLLPLAGFRPKSEHNLLLSVQKEHVLAKWGSVPAVEHSCTATRCYLPSFLFAGGLPPSCLNHISSPPLSAGMRARTLSLTSVCVCVCLAMPIKCGPSAFFFSWVFRRPFLFFLACPSFPTLAPPPRFLISPGTLLHQLCAHSTRLSPALSLSTQSTCTPAFSPSFCCVVCTGFSANTSAIGLLRSVLDPAFFCNTTKARLPDNNPPHPLPQPCSGTTHTSRRTPWTRSS